jgi:hypothetical protein
MVKIGATLSAVNRKNTVGVKFCLLAFCPLGAAMAKIGATLLAFNRKNTAGVKFCLWHSALTRPPWQRLVQHCWPSI